ncbi:MAG: single-stranded DNA-binding protein [Firmicutes bacterium]|nr:single-stranded DNA-binding protein [Bacillota bacterium]
MTKETKITDNLEELLAILPEDLRLVLKKMKDLNDLIEVVMDLGRRPEARFPGRMTYLKDEFIVREDIDYVVQRVGAFGKDNRAGIERTLHRISAIRNRTNDVIGLTMRVGRAVYGTIDLINDFLDKNVSILLMGKPGIGKTTMLREAARVLADEIGKRVVIVDTSNEIAGDGDIPHTGIGIARRMQVPSHDLQHEVMIEAVQNHMPEVIVVDEIGTEQEAYASRTIAERGVMLIATAHGNTLENLLMNPTLSDLVGGVQAVTLSDEEARKRRTQKTVLERKSPPTFDIVIEIQEKDRVAIHKDVAHVIDTMLRGKTPKPEIRVRDDKNGYNVLQIAETEPYTDKSSSSYPQGRGAGRITAEDYAQKPPTKRPVPGKNRTVNIFPYAISRNRLEKAIEGLRVNAVVVRRWEDADVILTLKSQNQKGSKKLMEMAGGNVAVHSVRSNTVTQLQNFVRDFFQVSDADDMEIEALKEVENAVEKVKLTATPVELMPRNSYLRRLQHQLIEKYELKSCSTGKEPFRRVKIYIET